jgi:hypothetical protein
MTSEHTTNLVSLSCSTNTSNYASMPGFNFRDGLLKIDPCQWRQNLGPDAAKEIDGTLTPDSNEPVRDPQEAYMCRRFALFVWRLPGAPTMVASTGILNAHNCYSSKPSSLPLALLSIAVSKVWRFNQHLNWQHFTADLSGTARQLDRGLSMPFLHPL